MTLEDGDAFPLYGKELTAYGIVEDEEISESDFCEIMEQVLPKRARMRAMYLLKAMDRTEAQLRRKLAEMHYPDEIVQNAIDYVKGYRYIDDLRYALSYMEYRKDSKSVRQMEQELYQKGVSKEIVEEAVQQIELPDEEVQIRSWLLKKHYDPKQAQQKETERMYRFLMRKGYSMSSIRRVVSLENLYE